jgi:hypothetical protein
MACSQATTPTSPVPATQWIFKDKDKQLCQEMFFLTFDHILLKLRSHLITLIYSNIRQHFEQYFPTFSNIH